MKTYLLILRTLILVLQTYSKLKAFLNEGDISEYQYKKFHEAAHRYYRSALDYMQKKFPISDEIIVNGAWIDVENRAKATWRQVRCFLDRYSDIEVIQNIYTDKVYDEFCDYQLLSHDDTPGETCDEAKFVDGKDSDENEIFNFRMHNLWW